MAIDKGHGLSNWAFISIGRLIRLTQFQMLFRVWPEGVMMLSEFDVFIINETTALRKERLATL